MTDFDCVALVTARGGSKGLPGKNIRLLGGKPLIGWTIEAALQAPSIRRTLVSTDCERIARVSREAGAEVPFLRPPELSTDTATSVDVCLHALADLKRRESYRPAYLLLLQPTSPLRNASHIEQMCTRAQELGADAILSVTRCDHHPMLAYGTGQDQRMVPLFPEHKDKRRQDLPQAFQPNGAMYLVRSEVLLAEKTLRPEGFRGFEMAREASVDIDELLDFKLAELLLAAERGLP